MSSLFCFVLAITATCTFVAGQPSNDNCQDAIAVNEVTNLEFDTRDATFDGPHCYVSGPNIWYRYTASCTGDVTVSLAGSDFDTELVIYDGGACYPSCSDMIEANNNFHTSLQSQVTFAAIAGNEYLIEIGGHNSAVNTGLLNISCAGQPGPPSPPGPPSGPSNDDCADAQWVGNVTNLSFDTSDATFDGPGLCMDSPNIWFCYTASCSGTVTISLADSSFDTMLAVYNGCQCNPTSGRLIQCNDDYGSSQQSRVTFITTTGHQYLIEVGGYGSESGNGRLSISCGGQPGPPSAPYNDDCADAQSVGNVTNLSFDTSDATFDGPGLCMDSPNIWYCYTASCSGTVTVSLAGSSFDTMLAVYNGCQCNPTSGRLIQCNDDYGSSQQSRVTFTATTGHQYLIEVGGYGSETGDGRLSISCGGQPGPPYPSSNDNCAGARSIGNVTNMAFDTSNATFDGPGLCISGPNIWYCYTAQCSGDVTVSLAGSSFDTMLAVYRGCSCYLTQSRLMECNDDFGGSYQSEVTFTATAGSQYLIEIGGYGSDTGQGILNVSCGAIVVPGGRDLGDAPDSTNNFGTTMTAYASPWSVVAEYPTVYNDGSGFGPYGPMHVNAQTVAYLGKTITGETEADTGSDDDGTNNIRPPIDSANRDQGDDGVVFPVNLPNCDWATIDYTVTVAKPGTDLWVNVWLDFNRDGDWDDTITCPAGSAQEWAVQNQFLFNLPAGQHLLTTPAFLSWHPGSGPRNIWMRITLSEQPWRGGSNPGQLGNGGSGPLAKYQIGETEDYLFTPERTGGTECSLCQDINGDGKVDIDDLAAFTAQWLAACP